MSTSMNVAQFALYDPACFVTQNMTAEASDSFVDRTIHAVGGIAVRKGARPRVAVVQRSKDKLWVLPRGK